MSKTKPREGLVISADYQSQGRGQHGSKWQSRPNISLALSMFLRPFNMTVDKQFLFTIWVSQALVDVLSPYLKDSKVKIKWPNDILVNERKIAGILMQNTVRGEKIQSVIIGVGLNVNDSMSQYSFPGTSLMRESGKSIWIPELRERVISGVWNAYVRGIQIPNMKMYKRAYEQQLWKKGEKVKYMENDEKKAGTILGVNENGELQLQTGDTMRILKHKEVRFLMD